MNVTDTNYVSIARKAPFLAAGGTREVFSLGDGTVLKVDRTAYTDPDTGDCGTEVDTYADAIASGDADHFATVYAYGTGWLVMEQCKVNGDAGYSPARAERWLLIEGYAIAAKYRLLGDLHADQIGQRPDGTFCFVDYAHAGMADPTGDGTYGDPDAEPAEWD